MKIYHSWFFLPLLKKINPIYFKMKKTKLFVALALVLGALTLVGCKKDPKDDFVLKEDTWLCFNVDKNTMKADEIPTITPLPKDQNLTPRQMIQVASRIDVTTSKETWRGDLPVEDYMKDFKNCRIKRSPYCIIGPRTLMIDGKLVEKFIFDDWFITTRDMVLTAKVTPELGLEPKEIIGYIPNATMEKAEKTIREAWAKGDKEAMYKFFNDAYTIIPIREGAYNKLKEEGKL